MRPVDPRAWPVLRPGRAWLGLVVAAGSLAGLLVVAQAFAVARLLDRLLTDPAGHGWWVAALALVGVCLARALAGMVTDVAAARAAARISTALRGAVLGAAMRLGRAGLSGRRSGELGLLATRGVAAVEPYLTRFVPTGVLAAVLPPVTVAMIAWQDPWSALVVVATLPLVPVFAVLIGLATRDRAERQYRTLGVLAGHFLDVVRGLPTLVGYGRAQRQAGAIREVTERHRRATLATLRTAFASSAALEGIATLSVALVAVCVGLRLATGGMDFETALLVLLLAPEAYWPLRRVGAEFHAAAEGAATLVEVVDLLEEAPVVSTTAAVDDEPAALRVDPLPIRTSDLVVRYDERTVLRLPASSIPATGLTVVAGPSGCGKSTLLQVLLGEIAPERGSVRLAGLPLDPATLRPLVAQVPQRPWLTAGTVAENLRIGRPEADEAALWRALAAVDLGDTVAALPHGLDTALGEDGAGLSAGQRARLSLARVVLADRPYVVLDEPTAHLDAATEAVIVRTLRRLATHATVIAVAHRPALLAAADTVITLPAPAEEAPTTPGPSAAPTAAPVTAVASATAPAEHPAGTSAETAVDPTAVAPGRARARLALATLLGTLAAASGVALTATAGWLIARSAEQPPILTLTVAIVGVRTFGVARPAFRYAERLVSHDVALRLLADTRARVYDVLVPLVPARLSRRRGDLLTSVVDDVDAELDRRLRVQLPVWTWLGVSALAALTAALVHPPSLGPVLTLSVVAGLGAWWLGRYGAARAERAFVEQRAALAAEVVTDLQDARQLVLWQQEGAATERLSRLGDRLGGGMAGTATALGLARGLVVVAGAVAVAATASFAGPALGAGDLSGPMAALLVLVPLALVDVLLPLAEAGAVSARTCAASARLAALRALTPAVTEPAEPEPGHDADAGPIAGTVGLERVSAGWTSVPVLHEVDLHLDEGSSVGVVGPSGGGKSTLAAVLVRHLEPMTGRYLLGGADTTRLGSAVVRRHVRLVDDDPYVFGSSLRENLRLASPGSNDAMLLAALDRAGLGAWRAGLADGLDTMLGDGGRDVSGGERARLGIARALLADPEVLVLDEPTAHLDGATARAVATTLLAQRHGRALVWITHDGIALDALDAVLTLQDGHLTSPTVSGDLRTPQER